MYLEQPHKQREKFRDGCFLSHRLGQLREETNKINDIAKPRLEGYIPTFSRPTS